MALTQKQMLHALNVGREGFSALNHASLCIQHGWSSDELLGAWLDDGWDQGGIEFLTTADVVAADAMGMSLGEYIKMKSAYIDTAMKLGSTIS